MTKKASKSEDRLLALRKRCVAVLEFLRDQGRLGPLADHFFSAVESAYAKGSVPALQAASKDLDSRIRSLSESQQRQLAALLAQEVPSHVEDDEPSHRTEVRSILRRGRIVSDDEYRVLSEWADENFSDPQALETLERVNSLLATYKSA